VLEHAPYGSDRAVRAVGAEAHGARVALAEARVEEAAPQGGQGFADVDLLGGAGEGVAALLAPRAEDETAPAQEAHHLGHGRAGDALLLAQRGDGEAVARVLASQPQQAAQSVFFLSRQLHMSPSCRRAASDIFVWSHGGSSCTCTSTSLTPASVLSLPSMSWRSTSPIPHPGAVRVKRTATFLPSSGRSVTSAECTRPSSTILTGISGS